MSPNQYCPHQYIYAAVSYPISNFKEFVKLCQGLEKILKDMNISMEIPTKIGN